MQVAMITGAANGIGAATARIMVQRGMKVVLVDVDDETGRNLESELGPSAEFHRLDVSDPVGWVHLKDHVLETHGRIDILVLNAGTMSRPRGARVDDDTFGWLNQGAYERVLAVNQHGVVNGTMTFLPVFLQQESGRVLVISSVDALIPYPQDPFYAMAKASQLSFVRSMGELLKEFGVSVNALCPFSVLTDLTPENFRDLPERSISPEVFAEAVTYVLKSETTGEVWLKYHDTPEPCVHEFSEVQGIEKLYSPAPELVNGEARARPGSKEME
ncbi:SDR family oxidoreductase [Haloechinothrix sp. YIM 98757]|uniref:SDR family oxidoreductase n=1 Tax=Haloechinothrix aidingensis TaxID=2752311 RepID=A0A837ZVZ9_9PSEU|nr:SDR family oxidoreductase [Haloechinothrix aidingensis]MBA0124274.1 SDR family oxidoreductase [Haloechinothrix aidingensis]